MLLLVLLIPFFLLNVAPGEICAKRYTPEVTLKAGKIRGLLVLLNTGGTVRKYLGIPFAKAQRFQAPTDPDSWTGVKNMTSFGKICPQEPNELETFSDMSEDCLQLNVFTPDEAGSSPLPVMVWIHGGGFMWGSNRMYDGSYIASLGNVIVVAVSYRLGLLGFLASGKDDLKGNYGMLDQIHALKWVKNNIKSFGGDPGKVTIFGESAGGVSVSLLVLSPMAKGLFQRAIAQSGDANNDWSHKTLDEALAVAKVIAKESACASVQSLGDCLKRKSFKELVSVSKKTPLAFGIAFTPVIDGNGGFLPDSPHVLFKNGKFADVDIMIGFTNDEGILMTNAFRWPGLKPHGVNVTNGLSRSNFLSQLELLAIVVYGTNPVINEGIIYLYTDWNNITDPYVNRRMYIDIATDGMMIAPAVKSAKAIANKTSNIYVYELQHRLETFFNITIPSWVKAHHGADIAILFGQSFQQAATTSVTIENRNFSREMISMWTNFAKTGDPNKPKRIPVTWPKYDVDQQKVIALKPKFDVQEKPRSSHVAFFNQFIPAALKAMPRPTALPCVDSNALTLNMGIVILIEAIAAFLLLGY